MMSELSLKIALVFLPGIIAYVIMDKLTFHEKHQVHHVVIYSYIFGFISYVCYYLTTLVAKYIGYELSFVFAQSITDGTSKLNLNEIAVVSGMSILVGIVLSWIINKGYIFKMLVKLKITKKWSSNDVWLSAMCKEWLPYVEIRDLKNKRKYTGWIENFSEYNSKREVLLRDVIIEYQEPKTYEEKTPAIYLALDEDFAIKFTAATYHDEPKLERRVNNGRTKKTAPTTATEQASTNTAAATTISSTKSPRRRS